MNITEHHDKMFEQLPKWIVEESIKYLPTILSQKSMDDIRDEYEKDHDTWWASSHFTWGMYIRNKLRDNVCLDDELPSKNWDDYYVRLIEMACGLK